MFQLRRRQSTGQALPEFALVLPILMVVLLIAIDFGRLFFGWVTLTNAARIAANYAAAEPTGPFGPGSEYETVVRNETNSSNCSLVSVSLPTFAPDTNVGSTATVSLTCNFKMLTPIIGGIVGDPLPLSATSKFVVRSGFVAGIPVAPPGPSVPPGPSAPPPSASPGPSPSPPAPCPSGTQAVPNLVGLTVGAARTLWRTTFTGSFSPNGLNNKIVTGQVPDVGTCQSPSSSMVVQHT